jgi:hypothetical protein
VLGDEDFLFLLGKTFFIGQNFHKNLEKFLAKSSLFGKMQKLHYYSEIERISNTQEAKNKKQKKAASF